MSEQHISPSTVAKLFEATFSSANNETIKQAEKALEDLSKDASFPSILL